MVRIFLILLSLSICNTLFGEVKTGYVDGDTPSVSITFDSPVDYSYTLSAAPKGGWVFTDEFYYPSGNGWYRSGGYSISCEQLEGDGTTVFVDAASVFAATISGRMYIPDSEGGSPIGWNVTGSGGTPVNVFIEPATAILPITGGEREFSYRSNNLNLNFGALWKYTGMNIEGESINTNWSSGGNIFTFPNLKAGEYQLSAARNSNGALSALANITLVQIKSLSATANGITVTSTTDSPGDDESVCIDVKRTNITGGSVTVTALPEPGNQWPKDQPEWYIGDTKVQTGGSSYEFSAGDRSAGKYTIEARCGNSKKAINVYIVQSNFYLIVQASASGAPIELAFDNIVTGDFVGHVAWRLSVMPLAAMSVHPFKGYESVANVNVGFHANSNAVVRSGKVDAPTPSFHVPDTIGGTVHTYPTTLSKMKNLLAYTDVAIKNPGNYILGTSCYVHKSFVVIIDWTHPASRNCASTARAAGNSEGLGIPSAFGSWSGSIAGMNVLYGGEAPSFLAGRL